MKKLLFLSLLAGLSSCTTTAQSEDTKAVNLIELFTSEGCSSCPSAEALLQQLQKEDENLIVLSFHVDYWDRLGWKDAYSRPKWTRRQTVYANTLGVSNLYTPQAIVNGSGQVTGSNRTGIADLLKKYSLSQGSAPIAIQVSAAGGQCSVTYKAPVSDKEVLQIVLVKKEVTTNVEKGENEGKTLRHTNVVLESTRVNNSKGQITFPLPAESTNSNYAIVAFIQQRANMQITSVVEKSL